MRKKILTLSRKDFRVDTFRGSGPGGQHRNKTDSAVRITHTESGAVSESKTEKSQHQNRKKAFHKLPNNPKFKLWLSRKIHEISTGKTIEERVEESFHHENLKIESKKDGKWEPYVEK